MPDSFLHIPGLLKPEELEAIDQGLDKAEFADGRATASMAAREVKNNLQVADEGLLPSLQQIVHTALMQSPLFQAAVMPKYIYPFIFSKYTPGMFYGWHVDSPIMGNPPLRTDIAMTIFLSDPVTYTGGELVIQTAAGAVSLKPAKGDAIVYPCQFLHCVNEVKEGERKAAVTWIQSIIASPAQRKLLFDIQQVQRVLQNKDMHAPETQLLLQAHSNLLRMWMEA